MSATVALGFCLLFSAMQAVGQGTLEFSNVTAPTRIGTIDGPLASANIAAHLWVGGSPNSLARLGPTRAHYPNGIVLGGEVVVPDIPPFATAYVQMWAWNWQVWGLSLDAVPPNQFGKTDIIAVVLEGGTRPPASLYFTQPAIVPPVPEPPALVLAALGGGLLGLRFRTWRRSRCPIERKARRPSVSATVALGFCLLFSAMQAVGQGTLDFINGTAPTRIGSIDGPLAGTNIAAHLFVGLNPDSLLPVGPNGQHYTNGIVYGGEVVVPGIPPFATAYVQMLAWDWQVWGLSLGGVPPNQFGKTDIIAVVLEGGTRPPASLYFAQPAVVPLVPEPSVLALALLGAGMLGLRFRTWRRSRCPIERKARRPSVSATVALGFCLLFSAMQAVGQGTLDFINVMAPTRIGSIDGPLAGTNIAAHLLVGIAPDSLSPVGPTRGHQPNGIVLGGGVVVPGIPEFATAYVQMWAWDGQVWGFSLAAVPPNQFGKTDIIAVVLEGGTRPPASLYFTQPAIVPPVPEPSVRVLALLGAGMLGLRFRTWRRSRCPMERKTNHPP